MAETVVEPSAKQLLRGWERLNMIKNQLVKAGLLNGDATPAQTLAKVKEVVPPELMA